MIFKYIKDIYNSNSPDLNNVFHDNCLCRCIKGSVNKDVVRCQ